MAQRRSLIDEMLAGMDGFGRTEQVVLFPPDDVTDAAGILFGFSPQTVSNVDISTPAGAALGSLGLDPLIEQHLSRIGHHDGRDD
jgi:hypothetical protein